jgi:CRP/FNR family transcriptional regulator, cyclic AMP receptor protein
VVEQDLQENYIGLLRRSGESESCRAGELIFSRGDQGDRLYLVDKGCVSLRIGELTLEVVGPGGLFGEMAVIAREPRSASAVAETDCELVAIDKRRFWFLVQETPSFAEIAMEVMADRLRRETIGAS